MSTIKYVGIGSRKTPEDIRRKMFMAGRAMASLGFILRSGGAEGADESFESGVDDYAATHDADANTLKEIYLPWKGFRKNQSELWGSDKPARLMAKRYHSNWSILSCAGHDYHARYCYQVLGRDLQTPASFILCWTPEGAITGDTGQALRMAQDHGIPILNFATDEDDYISDFIFDQAKKEQA